MVRLVIAFVVIAVALPLLGLLSSRDFAMYVAFTTVPATIAFALPAFFILRGKNWMSCWAFAIAGFVGGTLCALGWVALIGEPSGLITGIPFLGGLGALHGSAF